MQIWIMRSLCGIKTTPKNRKKQLFTEYPIKSLAMIRGTPISLTKDNFQCIKAIFETKQQ